jgi:ABC-2 type transport system ATP-binding protein
VTQPTALAVENLRKTYGSGAEALKGVTLSVAAGDFFALLGPNGAGKSTLIGIVSSLVTPSDGRVSVFGIELCLRPGEAKALIGVVPQEFNFNLWEAPLDIVVNQAGYYGIPRRVALTRAERYLRELDLWDVRSRPSRQLSGGMKRRLMIARALVHEPRLLILDEPTAGVDIEIRRSMWRFLRELNAAGTTIILTTHYLEEAESLCEHIAIIDDGELIENTDMKSLLAKLGSETFVLDLARPLDGAPVVEGYAVALRDPTTLEVEVSKERGINALFAELSRRDVEVLSMRNKANRLEELFLRLIEENDLSGAATERDPGAARAVERRQELLQ